MPGRKIGHIKREHAPKYQRVVYEQRLVSASLVKVSPQRRTATIRVAYEPDPDGRDALKRVEANPLMVPDGCGVYHVEVGGGRIYVGSTTNFRRRYIQHLTALTRSTHHNASLQAAFVADEFTLTPVYTCQPHQREEHEAREIRRLRNAGVELHNATEDGKGRYVSPDWDAADRTETRDHIAAIAAQVPEVTARPPTVAKPIPPIPHQAKSWWRRLLFGE